MEEILQQIIYGLSEVYGDEKFTEKRIGGTNNNYALPTRLFQVKGCFEYSKEIKALSKEDQEKFKQYDIGNFMSEELQISELIAKAYYAGKTAEADALVEEQMLRFNEKLAAIGSVNIDSFVYTTRTGENKNYFSTLDYTFSKILDDGKFTKEEADEVIKHAATLGDIVISATTTCENEVYEFEIEQPKTGNKITLSFNKNTALLSK